MDYNQNQIVYISTDKIHPHPDNPRKDLSDLSELAESIKARGILQNLTVVPWFSKLTGVGCDDPKQQAEMGYTVVIGHRRLAAAKLAGLTEVPCFISGMPLREQVATMLLENIQRSDLTIIEQAGGFQMMMDLGDTVGGIAEKTGFSDRTIQRRLALTKLDQKKLEESLVRGGTLSDYAELEKIRDEKKKNKLLEYIGTSNFKWQLESAIEEQELPERKTELIEFLKDWATPKKNDNGLQYVKQFWKYKLGDYKKPKDAEKTEYFYVDNGNQITLYTKAEKAEKQEASPEEKAFNERKAQIEDLSKRAYESRYKFVTSFTAFKKYAKEIDYFVAQRLLRYGADLDKLLSIFGIEEPDTKKLDYSEAQEFKRNLVLQKYSEAQERFKLLATYIGFGDSASTDYYYAKGWERKIVHEKNDSLDVIYDALFSLGYEMSDEEKQLRDGTHELFDVAEPEPDDDEDDLYECEAENCPFNDREGGCQFEPYDEESSDGDLTNWSDDVTEAVEEHFCQNPKVTEAYDSLDAGDGDDGEDD